MTTYYNRIDGKITQASKDPDIAAMFGLDLQTDEEIICCRDGQLRLASEAALLPPTIDQYDGILEQHLDDEKNARGYTKREPSEYAGSSNPRWKQDALDWIAHRDEVMEYALEIENKAAAGEPVPTLEEFKEGLPDIVWTYSDTSDDE